MLGLNPECSLSELSELMISIFVMNLTFTNSTKSFYSENLAQIDSVKQYTPELTSFTAVLRSFSCMKTGPPNTCNTFIAKKILIFLSLLNVERKNPNQDYFISFLCLFAEYKFTGLVSWKESHCYVKKLKGNNAYSAEYQETRRTIYKIY